MNLLRPESVYILKSMDLDSTTSLFSPPPLSLSLFYHVSYLMTVSENLSLHKLRDEKLLCIQLDKILGLSEGR